MDFRRIICQLVKRSRKPGLRHADCDRGRGPGRALPVAAAEAERARYFALRRRAERADSTFGFGVVFSEGALEFLKEDDPAIFAAITPELETWSGIAIYHRGERVMLDGIGFSAIGRLHPLQLLQKQARSEGISVSFNHPVEDLSEFADADMIVGADGVTSLVRRSDEGKFPVQACPILPIASRGSAPARYSTHSAKPFWRLRTGRSTRITIATRRP